MQFVQRIKIKMHLTEEIFEWFSLLANFYIFHLKNYLPPKLCIEDDLENLYLILFKIFELYILLIYARFECQTTVSPIQSQQRLWRCKK